MVTILLTGQADFGDVCAAVEKGGIFRLLAKPCHPDVLKKNIDQALEQYRLIRAEKELEQTLGATLNVLSSLLAASKPKIFRRAQRVEELVKQTVRQMKLPGGWRAGVAAKIQLPWIPHHSRRISGKSTPRARVTTINTSYD